MKEYSVILDSCTGSKLTIKLFKDVQNMTDIKQDVISGKLKCCVVKPNLIVHPMQIVIAANKAAVAEHFGNMITRTVYSETLFNLSPTKNVSKSLLLFGIDDKYTTVLVAVISKVDDENYSSSTFDLINGVECDIDELDSIVDYNLVKKTYGLTNTDNTKILNTVINKIVTKEC